MSLEKEIMDMSVTYIIYYKQSSFTIPPDPDLATCRAQRHRGLTSIQSHVNIKCPYL